MSNLFKEHGFAHPLAVLVFGIFAAVLISSAVPVNRNYNDGKSDVAGVTATNSAMPNKASAKADFKVASSGGQVAVVEKGVGALSAFPLSVNPKTNELTVTTPAGTKVVAVLPQKAVDNMLASGVMDYVVGEKVNNDLASVPSLVQLEVKNGVLGYTIKGTKTHKLLGLIPIKTSVTAFVSAENGQVVTSDQSLLGRILNKIAP